MPHINAKTQLKDPVGAIARRIERDGNDFSFGKPDQKDFVIWACETLQIERADERDELIANELYEDMGERYQTAQQVAAFLYARLVHG